MTKCLLYMAPIVLIGLVATEAPAATAAWSGSIGRNITATAPGGTGVPLVLVRGGGGVAAGAIVGGAVASTAYPAPAYPYPSCPYPNYRIADFERPCAVAPLDDIQAPPCLA